MAEKPNKREVIDIEFMIKKIMAESEVSANECVRLLNEKYQTTDMPQTVGRQLKQGNIPFWKVLRIAETLGYQVKFEKN